MTVQPYQTQLVQHTDSWTQVVEQVARLATQIANTELVPDALRGKAPAVAAVILYGREVGLPPMTALRTVYIVRGRVGVTAEAMRALVLVAGHEIEYRESSGARAVVAGRRKGSETWHTVTWTLDDARQAGLSSSPDGNWRKYPRAMLKARATAELCRDLFPDVIGGFEATEEVEDAQPSKPEPTTRIRRRRKEPATAAPADQPGEIDAAPAVAGPARESAPVDPAPAIVDIELPIPIGDDDAWQQQAIQALEGSLGPVHEVPVQPDQEPGTLPYTAEQRRMMMQLFAQLDVNERAERLKLTTAAVGRTITSANELSKDEASTVIDLLATAVNSPEPGAILDAAYAAAGYVADEPLPDPAEAADDVGEDR